MALVASTILIIHSWNDAKIGLIVNILLLPLALTAYGEWNLNKNVKKSLTYFGSTQSKEQVVQSSDLDKLPTAVKRWMHMTGVIGKPIQSQVRITQSGKLRTTPGSDWAPFYADQWVSFDPPGFVWHCTMDAGPGLHIGIVDKFIDGGGSMGIWMQSLVKLQNISGAEIDEGAMQRYMAEIVWNPSIALSPYISWDQQDEAYAHATMHYKSTHATVNFIYDEEGLVRQIEADRYYYQKDRTTKEKWLVEIDTKSYREIGGLKIPMKSSITWQLPQGDYKWFELEILDISPQDK